MTEKLFKYDIDRLFLKEWQVALNLLADLMAIPAALIMRVDAKEIEVLLSSNSVGNPYKPGCKEQLDTGLYCEQVMEKRDKLEVPNALKDHDWVNNPDVKLNMIAYLGFPLIWPSGEIFGTICVLDNKERHFSDKEKSFLRQFKLLIEANFFQITSHFEDLEKSKGLFNTAYENAPHVMMITDENLVVCDINKYGIDYLGGNKDKLLGKLGGLIFRCVNTLKGSDCGRSLECNNCTIRNTVHTTFSTGKSVVEKRIKITTHDKNNQEVDINFLLSTSLIELNGRKYTLATFVDITEEVYAKINLEESKAKFSLFMDNMPGIVFIKDSAGKYSYANKNMCELALKSKTEIIGLKDEDIFPNDTVKQIFANDARVIHEGKEILCEEHGTRDGVSHCYLTAKFPIQLSDNSLISVAGIGIDITEKKKLQHEKIELEKK